VPFDILYHLSLIFFTLSLSPVSSPPRLFPLQKIIQIESHQRNKWKTEDAQANIFVLKPLGGTLHSNSTVDTV
jgi:hypothetical protein